MSKRMESKLRNKKLEIANLLRELKKAENLKRHAYNSEKDYLEKYLKKKTELIIICSDLINNLIHSDKDRKIFSKELLRY